MMNSRRRAVMLATIFLATCAPVLAAPTPNPLSSFGPAPKAVPTTLPSPDLPKVPIHTEFVVEVNDKGQVVRVKSGKASKVPMFNAWTYGNVLQMWIRTPDGNAIVGLYKVTYDYDPGDHKVKRIPSLLSQGGTWANEEGAANAMIDIARKEAQEHQKQAQAQASSLPSLQQLRGQSPTPSPTPFIHSSPFV